MMDLLNMFPLLLPHSLRNVNFSRLFHIVNIFSTLLSSQRGQITDPTRFLPQGFVAKPNIRQGRASLSATNEIFPEALTKPKVSLEGLGNVEGYFMRVISGRQVYAFEGIPYAEPPVGNLRFRAPVPKRPWNGTLQAKSWGPMCVQTRSRGMRGFRNFRPGIGSIGIGPSIVGDEDCLRLNVYTPELPVGDKSPLLPVLVFIHGGAFGAGSSYEYGPSYLMQQDVVLVTLNYRLGVFGFLSTNDKFYSGNWGLKDQALAISWAHKHASSFGGDPKRLVLMGQSAGAVSVHLHMMSPFNRDKIFAAIALSGTAFNPWGLRKPTEERGIARRLARLNFCRTSSGIEDMMSCLRTRTTANITLTANLVMLAERRVFMPVVEPNVPGAFITKSPGDYYANGEVAKVPFICTTTSRELELTLAVRLAGQEYLPLLARPIVALAPVLLDYQDKVLNVNKVTREIAKFYGGEAKIRQDPRILGQMASDRHFSMGIRRGIQLHAKIAPTYSYHFDYRNTLGFASDLHLNPFEFGVPHGEDIIFLFNRTERRAIKRTDGDFAIVKLLQNLITNFATFGEPLYTSEEFQDFKVWDPVPPNTNSTPFLQIDRHVKMISFPEFDNATRFWNSLGIVDA